ncbi:MAG: peptidylprolyl isomerase [Flexilinea sp.]
MNNKKIILTIAFFVVFSFFAGFAFTSEAADDNIVAIVNGTNITLDDFQEAVRYKRFDTLQEYNYMAYLYSMYNMPLDESVTKQYETLLSEDGKKDFGQQVIDQLVYNKILEAETEKAGITVSDEEINQTLKEMFGFSEEDTTAAAGSDTETDTLPDAGSSDITPPEPEVNKEAEFQAAFDNYFSTTVGDLFSKDFFKNQIYHNLLESKLLETTVFANEVFEDEMVSARHILVETEEIAQEVLGKLKAGEDWNTLAAEYSKDTSNKDNGGDLGWFARGSMVLPFEEAAFALEPGEISDPVKTDFGYHIIASDGKETRPLEDEALNNAKYAVYKAWYEKIISEYDLETFDTWVDNIPMEPIFTPIEIQPVEETTDGSDDAAIQAVEPTVEAEVESVEPTAETIK